MRDICILTAESASTEELIEFMRSFALRQDQPYSRRVHESVVGEPPDVLYVFDTTDPTDCYFGPAEKVAIELKLGARLNGCVSVHFTSTDAAYALGDTMAREIARRWHGKLDYSGTGGAFEMPPIQGEAQDANRRRNDALGGGDGRRVG